MKEIISDWIKGNSSLDSLKEGLNDWLNKHKKDPDFLDKVKEADDFLKKEVEVKDKKGFFKEGNVLDPFSQGEKYNAGLDAKIKNLAGTWMFSEDQKDGKIKSYLDNIALNASKLEHFKKCENNENSLDTNLNKCISNLNGLLSAKELSEKVKNLKLNEKEENRDVKLQSFLSALGSLSDMQNDEPKVKDILKNLKKSEEFKGLFKNLKEFGELRYNERFDNEQSESSKILIDKEKTEIKKRIDNEYPFLSSDEKKALNKYEQGKAVEKKDGNSLAGSTLKTIGISFLIVIALSFFGLGLVGLAIGGLYGAAMTAKGIAQRRGKGDEPVKPGVINNVVNKDNTVDIKKTENKDNEKKVEEKKEGLEKKQNETEKNQVSKNLKDYVNDFNRNVAKHNTSLNIDLKKYPEHKDLKNVFQKNLDRALESDNKDLSGAANAFCSKNEQGLRKVGMDLKVFENLKKILKKINKYGANKTEKINDEKKDVNKSNIGKNNSLNPNQGNISVKDNNKDILNKIGGFDQGGMNKGNKGIYQAGEGLGK